MCSKLILVTFFVGLAAVFAEENVIPIVAQESDIEPDGKFHWSYESGDGTKQNQNGEIRALGEESPAVMQGSYSYQGDDGKTYTITYTADENGYQPVGEHLPVAPEIPPLIQKALDYLATAKPSTDDAA